MKYLLFLVVNYFLLTIPVVVKSQVLELPFEMVEDHLVIKLYINDQQPASFIFDTGAGMTVFDTHEAQQLGLQPSTQSTINGFSSSAAYDIVKGQSLTFSPTVRLNNVPFVLTDLSRLESAIGCQFQGIIGYDLLRKYVVSLDYTAQKLRLHRKIKQVDHTGYRAIPFRMYNNISIPQLEVSIQLPNGEQFSGLVFLDTGAGLTLSVNNPFAQKQRIRQKATQLYRTDGEDLNGQSASEQLRIASLQLDTFVLEELPISLNQSDGGVSSMPSYLGILGATVLKRFDLILDYQNKTLYLRPNAHFQKPFHFPTVGFQMRKIEGQIRVSTIGKKSLAYQKGLRVGDQILSINGVDDSDLVRYRRELQQVGTVATIPFRSPDGSIQVIQLDLLELI